MLGGAYRYNSLVTCDKKKLGGRQASCRFSRFLREAIYGSTFAAVFNNPSERRFRCSRRHNQPLRCK